MKRLLYKYFLHAPGDGVKYKDMDPFAILALVLAVGLIVTIVTMFRGTPKRPAHWFKKK